MDDFERSAQPQVQGPSTEWAPGPERPEQPMDEAVARQAGAEAAERAWARGHLAKAAMRMVATDGARLHGPEVDADERALRQAWAGRARRALEAAPTNQAFMDAASEWAGKLVAEFQEAKGVAPRAAFVHSATQALAQASGLIDANPSGGWNWSELSSDPPKPVTLPLWALRSARDAAVVASLGIEGGGSPEHGLRNRKRDLMLRFGLAEISFDGAPKTMAEEARAVAKIGKLLAKGAKKLGLDDEAEVGMRGKWSLRLIDAAVHDGLVGEAAYVAASPVQPLLGLSAEASDPSLFIHEWTHMLDFELGTQAKRLAAVPGAVEPWAAASAARETFFSRMPEQAKQLMPEARDGYWGLAAAAQGLEGAEELRAVAASRMEKLEALSARMELRLLADPMLAMGMSAEARAEFSSDVKGPLKALLTMPSIKKAAATDGLAQGVGYGAFGADGVERECLADVAAAMERHFGGGWRRGADGVLAHGVQAAGKAISLAAGSPEAAGLRELAAMSGSYGMPLSPESPFARGSWVHEVRRGSQGYLDSPEEMLARAVGRPAKLASRLRSAGALQRLSKGSAPSDPLWGQWADAYAPELGAAAQRAVARGFTAMAGAVGIAAAPPRGLLEKTEAALAAPAGRVAMEAATAAFAKGKGVVGKLSKAGAGSPFIFKAALGTVAAATWGAILLAGANHFLPALSQSKAPGWEQGFAQQAACDEAGRDIAPAAPPAAAASPASDAAPAIIAPLDMGAKLAARRASHEQAAPAAAKRQAKAP